MKPSPWAARAAAPPGRNPWSTWPTGHLSLDHLAAAARAIGLPVNADMNGPLREGFSTFQQTRRGRRRISAARAYLHPALGRPNLTVIDQALALRMVVEDGRATGIVIRRDGAERVVRARREVVLAAGAIGSPQLLMLSGLGPAAALAGLGIPVLRDMPGDRRQSAGPLHRPDGFRLAEHRWSANRRIAGWRLPLEALRWATRGDGVLTWSPGMFSLFARTAPGLEAPDIQLNGGPLSWAEAPAAPGQLAGLRIGVPEAEPG